MRVLYNSKYKYVKELTYNSKPIFLSPLESRLLEVLSNGEFNTWKEIHVYTYKENISSGCVNRIRSLLSKLLNKIPLNIVSDYGKRSSINR